MKRLLLVALCTVSPAVAAMPAAANQNERVGVRIDLLADTPTEIEAETPFHVAHGWWMFPSRQQAPEPVAAPQAPGKSGFRLEIDGVAQQLDFVDRWVDIERKHAGLQFLGRLWVFNFPSGLPAGTYTFTAVWFGACESLALSGFPVGPCAYPTEVKELPLSRTLTVTA
jgi:hypothetical protein